MKKDKNIKLILIVIFVSNMFFINTIQTLYYKQLGFSVYQIGILFSILQASKMIFEVPTGFIADKYGKKKSVLASNILSQIAILLFWKIQNYYIFCIAMIILGVSYTLSSGALDALFVDIVQKSESNKALSKYNSIYRLLFYISYGLSSIIAGIIAKISFEYVYLITFVIQNIPIILIIFINENQSGEIEESRKKLKLNNVFNYITRNKVILYYIVIDILISISMIPVDNFYSLYLYSSFGFNTDVVGILICLQFITCSVVGLYSDKLTTRLSVNFILCFFPIIMMIMFVLFSISNNATIGIIMYLLGLSIFCLFSPQKYKVFHSNMRSDYRATILSIESLIMAMVSMIVQPIFGYMSDVYTMKISFQILIGFSCLAICMHIIFNSKRCNYASMKGGEKNEIN